MLMNQYQQKQHFVMKKVDTKVEVVVSGLERYYHQKKKLQNLLGLVLGKEDV